MKNKVWMYLTFAAVAIAAVAQVNVKGLIVDAKTGYTVNGAAPNGQALCGNGTKGTFAASCAINSATATALATTPTQCSGTTPLSTGVQANGNANCSPGLTRTCNANGCYIQYPDGTIEAWGETTMSATGTSFNTASVTYPTTFTSQAIITFDTVGQASNTGDPNMPPCSGVQTKSLSSATLFFARCVIASAGGGNFDNSMTIEWHVKGY